MWWPCHNRQSKTFLFIIIIWSCDLLNLIHSLAFSSWEDAVVLDRRDWLIQSTTTATNLASSLLPNPKTDGSILHIPTKTTKTTSSSSTTTASTLSSLDIPRVGYSLYKTNVTQAALGVQLALQAGVQHLDLATMYGSNPQVGQVLQSYFQSGIQGVSDDPPFVSSSSSSSLPFLFLSQQERRRRRLFLTLKLQPSSSKDNIRQTFQKEMNQLGVSYIDLVMIHSPLSESKNRLVSYQALLDLQRDGLVHGVGVCHYGIGPLNELLDAGLPPPAVIQLVLSPFNQHKDVAAWAQQRGSVLSCSAWSMLSSVNGPQEGWDKLSKIAKTKGMTKAQILVRWALQRGFLCVPRSGTKSKMERLNIAENSYRGVQSFVLDASEMDILNGLDEQLPVGRLGILDGWNPSDIVSPSWDPTLVV